MKTEVPAEQATTAALAAANLHKRFGASLALAGVDLTVQRGEVHALLGENGSGKSTLIKVLSGFHRPDSGSVTIAGRPLDLGSATEAHRLGARFVHQDLGLIDDLSVADNLALGSGFVTRLGTVRSRANAALARSDLERAGVSVRPDARVGDLSPALKTGVAIARALRADEASPARLLVLDEPTATLPVAEVRRLIGTVRRVASNGIGVLYVTHRLDEVFDLADRVTVLRDGRKVATRCTTELDHASLVDLLVAGELTGVQGMADSLSAEGGEVALAASDITGASVTGVSLEFRSGQITGIAGITGSGREALLGTLFGAVPRGGMVRVGDGVVVKPGRPDDAMRCGVAFLSADRKGASGIGALSAGENLTLPDLRPLRRWWTMSRRAERTTALDWFKRLDVRPADRVDQPLQAFSGGNQQKILLAKWLRREPAVLLLDEPTQGVDIGAKALLHRWILREAERGVAVAISSSDVDELAALCQRILVCHDGRIVAELTGAAVTPDAITRECLRTQHREADNRSTAHVRT